MLNKIQHPLHVIFGYIWSIFLTGLIAILPLALTISLFSLSFRLLKNWLAPIQELNEGFFDWIPHSEILLVVCFILLLGAVLQLFVIKTLIHSIENLFAKIPLVRPIYSGIKQLVHAFNPHNKMSFKHIVLVEFPRAGIWSLGFLTSELPPELCPDKETPYYNVFIPATPNPIHGFFVCVQEADFKIVDLTHQEAMALIMSGGIIQPERFAKK